MLRHHLFFLLISFICLITVACEKEIVTLDVPLDASAEDVYPGVVGELNAHSSPLTSTPLPSPNPLVSPIEEMIGQRATLSAVAPPVERTTSLLSKLALTKIDGPQHVEVKAYEQAPLHFEWYEVTTTPERGMDVATIEVDCLYGECASMVPDLVAQYQEIARQQCQDQFLCITCCFEGDTNYVVIFIEADCMPMAKR